MSALLERSLVEQRERNAAALVAIEARAPDIAEAERFANWLAARGHQSRVAVNTASVGTKAFCNITLWLSTSERVFGALTLALAMDGVELTRMVDGDRGQMRGYVAKLAGQSLPLLVNVVAAKAVA